VEETAEEDHAIQMVFPPIAELEKLYELSLMGDKYWSINFKVFYSSWETKFLQETWFLNTRKFVLHYLLMNLKNKSLF